MELLTVFVKLLIAITSCSLAGEMFVFKVDVAVVGVVVDAGFIS